MVSIAGVLRWKVCRRPGARMPKAFRSKRGVLGVLGVRLHEGRIVEGRRPGGASLQVYDPTRATEAGIHEELQHAPSVSIHHEGRNHFEEGTDAR
jgi:hypothetical protein